MLGERLNLRRREDRCFNCSTSLFIHFPIPESVIKCLCSWTTNTIKFPKSSLFCLQQYLIGGFLVFILIHEFSCSQSLFSPYCWGGVNEQLCECMAGTWGQPTPKNCSQVHLCNMLCFSRTVQASFKMEDFLPQIHSNQLRESEIIVCITARLVEHQNNHQD